MKKQIIGLILSLGLTCAYSMGASVVFDPTNWMTALNSLYSAYDQVNNTIKQIEQNYEQMQHLIQEAAQLDWENIQWDGDFDIRDEISDVNTQINKRITSIRKIEDCFTKKTLTIGGQKFAYSDLMNKEGWLKAGVSAFKEVNNSFDTACDAWCGNLSDKQKAKIWKEYGISPKNYYYLQAKNEIIQDKLKGVVGKAEEEYQNGALKESSDRLNQIINKILKSNNLTDKEIAQYTSLLIQELGTKMELMKQDQDEAVSAQKEIDMLEDQGQTEKKMKEEVLESMDKGTIFNEFNFQSDY